MPLKYGDRIADAIDAIFRPLLNSRHDFVHPNISSTGLANPARLLASHIDMHESILESHTTVIANAALLGIEGERGGIDRNLNWVKTNDSDVCGQTKAVLALRTTADGDIVCRSAIG